MKLLLLGGTSEAKILAKALHENGIELIYSIAGLVRTPNLNCQVMVGGFSKLGGLNHFIQQHKICGIIDATHPYAQRMSDQAVLSAKQNGIPCWRFNRPPWQPTNGDNWIQCNHWQDLLNRVRHKKALFLAAGQLSKETIEILQGYENLGQYQVLRTAVLSTNKLPGKMKWLKSIGPFSYQDECKLMQQENIDALVSKNSGGEATQHKLKVARELAIPVYMLKRPQLVPCDQEFNDLKISEDFLVDWFKTNKKLRVI